MPRYIEGLDMNTHAAIREVDALRRIVALLVALAAFAERAGSLSLPLRLLVLSILRPAETVARAFVVDATPTRWPGSEEPPFVQSRPLDATWLAASFRALAAALGAMVRLACCFQRSRVDWAPRRLATRPHQSLVAPRGAARRPDDTS